MFQEEPVQIPGTVEETPVPIDLIDTIAARFDQNVLEQTKNKIDDRNVYAFYKIYFQCVVL